MTLRTLPRYRWFQLGRHDGDPANPPADPSSDPPADPPADPPKPEDALGDAGKKALAEERAARKAAERLAAEQAAKLKEFEDRDKTDAQKLTERAEAAEKAVQTATARAVRAEVKAAASEFADPTDAVALLGDLGQYAKDGDVDSDAIAADLAKLLEQKPHLRRAASGRTGPRPDPSQGPRGSGGPVNYRDASPDEVSKALADLGIRTWR